MYSLNVPVPGEVAALAADLGRSLGRARARTRGEHTLVLKRLTDGDAAHRHRVEARAREALRGAPAVEARVAGVDLFEEAVTGSSPVVYLAVESPGLRRLHERLVAAFDPVADLEGEAYVPHVTVARGGDPERARALADREVEPVTWTVSRLEFWDAERGRAFGEVSLPA